MKVIGQLISYFQSRGALSQDQLDYLTRQGFILSTNDDDGDTVILDDEPSRDVIEPAPEDEYEEAVAGQPRRRGRGGARRPRKSVAARRIAAWLQERFPRWRKEFIGFEQLAVQGTDRCEWREAVKRLRRASANDLRRALTNGFERQAVSLRSLWDSLGFDKCHELAERPGLQGRAISAYRALLAASDVAHVSKHQWLLRYEPVSDVFNVLCSQRLLAHAFGELFDNDPPLVSAAMRHHPHPLAYWSLVILYNAVRGPSEYDSLAHREYGPLLWLGDDLEAGRAVVTLGENGPRCDPDYGLWMRAWSLALVMNPTAVTPFFAASVNCDGPTPLLCPAGWRLT